MNRIGNTTWFLVCGTREQVVQTGAFGVFGAAIAFYCDVGRVFTHAVWLMAAVFALSALALLVVIARAGINHHPLTIEDPAAWPKRTTRSGLPAQLLAYRSIALFSCACVVMLVFTGLGQTWAAAQAPAADDASVSFFATLIPELQKIRGGIDQANGTLDTIERQVTTLKKETSDDPRKELANRSVSWSVDAFFEAIRRGDIETVAMFVRGGMSTSAPDSQGRPLPVILALTSDHVREILDALVHGGLDVNRAYDVAGGLGPRKTTLLGRAIEKGNLPLVNALLEHGVRMNEPIQATGAMGLTRETYPLASAVYLRHLDIAAAMLDGGADAGVGDYAAYREARATAGTRGALADSDPLLARLAPPAAAKAHIDAELRLQAVERDLNRIGADSIRAPRGSAERARLDRDYDSLQQERAQLQATLGR